MRKPVIILFGAVGIVPAAGNLELRGSPARLRFAQPYAPLLDFDFPPSDIGLSKRALLPFLPFFARGDEGGGSKTEEPANSPVPSSAPSSQPTTTAPSPTATVSEPPKNQNPTSQSGQRTTPATPTTSRTPSPSDSPNESPASRPSTSSNNSDTPVLESSTNGTAGSEVSTSNTSGTESGLIVGGVVGGLVLCLGMAGLLYRWHSSRQRRWRKSSIPAPENKLSPPFKLNPQSAQAKHIGFGSSQTPYSMAQQVPPFAPVYMSAPKAPAQRVPVNAHFATDNSPQASHFQTDPRPMAPLRVTNNADQADEIDFEPSYTTASVPPPFVYPVRSSQEYQANASMAPPPGDFAGGNPLQLHEAPDDGVGYLTHHHGDVLVSGNMVYSYGLPPMSVAPVYGNSEMRPPPTRNPIAYGNAEMRPRVSSPYQ